MNYQEALSFLFSQLPMFSRVGAAAYKPGLDTSLAIDNHFGHPHSKFKSIHVGGTNGKGSTSHMLAAVLQSQGYKTGLYTSPHLVDFRERMRINGEMIPEEKVIEFVEKWQHTDYDGHPSFFELTMMMAFDWFAKENVDYAVIEVGMGGRLDSTNIITPEMCVITNISNDHTQFLGDTLPKIATEKAGIIKPGIPVIVGEAEGEIRHVFESKAKEVGAPVVFAEDYPLLKSISEDTVSGGWRCTLKEGDVIIPLAGDYQKKNIETVAHALECMRNIGITLSDNAIINGLNNVDTLTGLRGRWTRLNDAPLVIADTGHNIAGITYNMEQLSRLLNERKNGKLKIVIGFVADKTIDKILPLLPKDAEYYITNAQIPRALPADQLKVLFEEAQLPGETYPDVKTAYTAALESAKPEDIVFVGGSTFIVADLLASIEKF
ncbi:MAG: bifunctional folylpolyglutamate synthase/dihydrofolate synthase [Bacteroides sp.]|nr:bifunctional folylpolyglutamate synthase/dihydrofolate synthase [Bacteroides sp.]